MPFAAPSVSENFTTTAGPGTDCITSITRPYDALSPTPVAPGDQTLTVTRSPAEFLLDNLTEAVATELSLHVPNVGGAWINDILGPTFRVGTAGFMTMPGFGTTLYHNNVAPPSADYAASFALEADPGYSDQDDIIVRYNPATGNHYGARVTTAGTVQLYKSIAGVITVLDSAPFAMPALGSGPKSVTIIATGTNLFVEVASLPTLSAIDASIAPAGFAGVQGNRGLGQPVHVSAIFATD